jgi:ABC-type anion transport system duplicated permease subunit
VYQVPGIGAELNRAVYESGERTMLFLSLALIIVTVVSFNRIVWARLYRHVHERYQMEG